MHQPNHVHHITGKQRHLNWRRGKHDTRDHIFPSFEASVTPPTADNSTFLPPVNDQGNLGSCTGNGGSELMEALLAKEGKPVSILSRLFLYYQTRVAIEGTAPSDDSGCEVRDVIKALHKFGSCLESTWPYDISQFSVKPSTSAFSEALQHKLISYQRCATLHSIQTALSQGYCVVFGFTCFESLMSAQTAATGDIPLPKPGEQEIGGHCVLIYGYDKARGVFKIRNSWGTGWGAQGNGTLPFDYFTLGYASDFWIGKRE